MVGLCLQCTLISARADCVVVFNEIMYHPAVDEAVMEWVELHNQMSVDVDLSGWKITGGVDFEFSEGMLIPGGGYLVIASSPAQLGVATGLTNILGPFVGRLSNSGEKLELRNRNGRLMDTVAYGVDGHWPVGPDGSGVSLAKRNEDAGSASPEAWTVSALVGGTPGTRNFAATPFEVNTTSVLPIDGTWKFEDSGADLGEAWRQVSFDDAAWAEGNSLFQAGNLAVQTGDPQNVSTVFSSGIGPNGEVLAAGSADPHFWLLQSAQSVPPPPAIAATVILNHPAWLANDSGSSWLGPINPGLSSVAAGAYTYRTTFSLDGFDPGSATLTLNVAADNRLNDVVLNGVSKGLSYVGFSSLSGNFKLTNGFIPGINSLDFVTANDGSHPNPAGFRVLLAGTARKVISNHSDLSPGRTNYYFRTKFVVPGSPRQAALQMNSVIADGAIFYLNGNEVFRWNMPTGPVGASTLAVSNVSAPILRGPFVFPSNLLLTGTNVLAVELHSAAGGSSNLLFGAELSLTATNVLAPPPMSLAFNEISSGTNSDFWVELINYGGDPIDLSGCLISRRGADGAKDFYLPNQTVLPGALLEIPPAILNLIVHSGDQLFLYGPEGASLIDAVVVQDRPRGRYPDGNGRWMYPSRVTPGGTNHFDFHRDVVINEIMYHPPALSAQPATFGTNILIGITNSWKYNALGLDLGIAWRAAGYDDTAWSTGSALFYHTTSVLPAPKQTELPLASASGDRIISWYFRTPFVFGGPSGSGQLSLNSIVDDGAVYYLNGVEVYRQNMPAGEVRASTLASAGVATPAFSGAFSIAVSNLLAGTNFMAVEVHQFTTNPIAADMAFGVEISTYGQQSPASAAQDSPESWIELFNRGSNEVNLAEWRLDEGVDFRFSDEVKLPAGGFLVVAKDVEYMRVHYPGISIVGPFTNKLSHSDDYLVLKDAENNPANEVHYYDGGRWSDTADGGGSSLELRDPGADNSVGEAWAASIETGRSSWSNYSYRAVARNVLGPTLWNEFVLGLLDAGECLLDDLSVVESPDTNPIQLLQNGSFESGLFAWRVLGDHGDSRVEIDPDQPGNHVLRLSASGPTDHIHNHLETTLANGRAVTDGKTYEISFRAKWLAGNNRLNTRLYFNRVAKTTTLAIPKGHGTPGRRNSTYVPNLGPTFKGLKHDPVVPVPNQPVVVSVEISDPQGVNAALLHWSADGRNWQTAAMLPAAAYVEGSYSKHSTTLPGFPAGTLIQFYAEATDGLGATAFFPKEGADSRAYFKVAEGKALMPQLHRFSLLVSSADAALLHAPTNVMSNRRIGLTVVYDEREVFYDVGVHLQSSERGRNDAGRVGFTIGFHPDQLFRGVQKGITLDRSGGYSGKGGRHDEILLWQAANHAGGIPALECDLVQLFAPRGSEDGTALLRLAAFDNDYFDSQFENGAEGSHYLLELIYYPTTTTTGDAQSPKLPQPDEVLNVDFQDWGNDPENYRWIFLQENQTDFDDYSKVIALNKAFAQTGAALDVQTRALMDVDEWLRALAFKAFTGDGDTYTAGLNHNWKFYFRPEDGRALGLLWDMDLAFNQPINTAFPGTGSASTYRWLTLPNNYRRYYNHLLDLMTRSVNAAHLGPWAARYAGLLGQNWNGAVDYLQQRADFIRGSMPLSTPFAISNNGGNNFSITNDHVTLTGSAPLTVKEIQINGVSYPLTWTSLTAWTLSAPLPAFVNVLVARGIDNYGALMSNALDTIVITNRGVLPPGPVVINEWMADNAAPGGFSDPTDGLYQDWIELYNPNDVAVDLSGFYLSDTFAEPTKWQIPTNNVIAPRGFLLVWADGDSSQNGLGTNGDLHANFQLSRSGEAIALYNSFGALQDSVVFGPQLQNVSQGLFPDGRVGAVYSMDQWSPRAPNQLGATPSPTIIRPVVTTNSVISLEYQTIARRTYRIEWTESLTNPAWNSFGGNVTATGSTTMFQDVTAVGQSERYYRVILVK